MDVNRALRNAAQTGTVLLGAKEASKAITTKAAKLVVLAANAPEASTTQIETLAQKNGVPVYRFAGKNTELGPACGKPFSVAVLAVTDAGESDVLQLARGA
jgi:large subunit ribosomal protein L30e